VLLSLKLRKVYQPHPAVRTRRTAIRNHHHSVSPRIGKLEVHRELAGDAIDSGTAPCHATQHTKISLEAWAEDPTSAADDS
jgi:hypothetical protein